MHTKKLNVALASVSALAMLPTSGHAQTSSEAQAPADTTQADAGAAGLEDIIVTARRSEENLQKVPIAITAFSEQSLKQNDIRAFSDIARFTPALSQCCNRVNPTSNSWIRGVPGVRAYFADVPVQVAGFGLLFDLENVQVLKGPQGTLFGVATNGGAILNVPRKPTSEFGGYGEVTLGNLDRLSVEGALNVPIVSDKILLRLGFVSSHRDGTVLNVANGRRYGDENYQIARASLVIRPSDGFENYTIANYFTSHNNRIHGSYFRAFTPTGSIAKLYGASTLAALLDEQHRLGPWKIGGLSFPDGVDKYRVLNLVNTTTWEITDDLTLKNIFGFESYRALEGNNDIDGTVLPITSGSLRNTIQPPRKTWSDEIQLQGNLFNDMLKLTVGAFFTATHHDPIPNFSNSNGTIGAFINKLEGSTQAVYGQGTFDLSYLAEGLSVTAGYRYSWDTRTQTNTRLDINTLLPNRVLQGEGHFKAGSYTFGLNYQVTPDIMLFIQDSKGYSSGGLNLTAPVGFQTFEPESLNNLEAGIKSQIEIGSWKARVNASAYYGWYKDVQVNQFVLAQINPLPAPKTVIITTTNAGKARIKGVDLDMTLIPSESLQLSLGLAYNEAGYTEFLTLDPATGAPVDLSSSPFLGSGKWKIVGRGEYHLPVNDRIGDISVSATYAWQSRVYADTANPNPTSVSYVPSFGSLDASLNWRRIMGVEGLDASLFANNITKNMWAVGGVLGYTSLGFVSTALADPRTYGLRVRMSF